MRNLLPRLSVFLVSVMLVFTAPVAAKEVLTLKDTSIVLKEDESIVEMLDSLIRLNYFENNQHIFNYTNSDSAYVYDTIIPVFSDSVYKARLALLDINSPINLDYNSAVQSYIDLYAVRKREMMTRILALSAIYFPLFEEQLDKYDLPLELKYLAIVESALHTGAKSRVGAQGLWQFMYRTGKEYGLNVTSYLDDRCDPEKATVAACEYFKDLYKIFGDWQLVLAAYNSGPGSVNKAIRRAGGNRNYWEIRRYLPLETRGYVPAFIAVNYVMNYTSSHNLYAAALNEIYLHTDTVSVNTQMRFDQISYILQIPVADLEFLNPSYKKGVIPTPLDGKCYALKLPADKVGTFVNNQNVICEYLKTPERIVDLPEPIYMHKTHTVRRGEVLGSIARKYNCSVNDLKKWNHLKGNNIRVGQKLKVLSPQKVAASQPGKAKPVAATTQKKAITPAIEGGNVTKEGKYIYHIVQAGDTLWSIASRYDGLSVEQLKKLNKSLDAKSLKPGTKIKIGISDSSS